jgi:hypothetical protein
MMMTMMLMTYDTDDDYDNDDDDNYRYNFFESSSKVLLSLSCAENLPSLPSMNCCHILVLVFI